MLNAIADHPGNISPDPDLRFFETHPVTAKALRELAYRCHRVALELANVANDEATTTAARLRSAATAAERNSDHLRGLAAVVEDGGSVSAERYYAAEAVMTAAGSGGILIDHRGSVGGALRSVAERKARYVEASGMFDHVAEPGQVPYWRLRMPEW